MKANLFLLSLALGICGSFPAGAQVVSLDSCRSMALANNKQLQISRQNITTAEYQNKEAFTAYLPSLDFAGGYTYNQKKISIFDKDQMLPTKTFNLLTQQYEFNLVKNPLTGEPIKGPDGQYVPESIALIPKEAMEYDMHNVVFGAITLTQPVYMGGKIKAMNKITGYAEDLARSLNDAQAEDVIYSVDAAYWLVVSLKAKERLAKSYVAMLDTLDYNVQQMLDNGVATRADLLSVDVKLNSARVDLTKVENGLSLSRMALAQVCGLPVNTVFTLADEDIDNLANLDPVDPNHYTMAEVYANRPDLHALALGVDIAGEQVKVARSEMLPTVAVVGAYTFSNPNMFNGFKKNFNGMFSVGAMVSIPLWHWGGNYYKYKKAESEQKAMRLKLEDAEEMINLQVSQASFKASEAVKTYSSTRENLKSADENLRVATLGFREGVISSVEVMAAQTAWLKANSENIDAMIDVYLCNTYLAKVLGRLSPTNPNQNY